VDSLAWRTPPELGHRKVHRRPSKPATRRVAVRARRLQQPPERLDRELFRAPAVTNDSGKQARDSAAILREEGVEVEDRGRRCVLGDDDVARGLHDIITRKGLAL